MKSQQTKKTNNIMNDEKNITPYDFPDEDMKKHFDEKYKGWEKDFEVLKQIYEQEEFRKNWEDRINPF